MVLQNSLTEKHNHRWEENKHCKYELSYNEIKKKAAF